jgi:hypothetical protein
MYLSQKIGIGLIVVGILALNALCYVLNFWFGCVVSALLTIVLGVILSDG